MLEKTESISERQIVIEKIVKAPVTLVFEAWTDNEHLKHWFGPDGFTITTESIDVRERGIWRFIMHGPDGTDFTNKIVFLEVIPPAGNKKAKLAYLHSDFNDEGRFSVSVEFEENDGHTKITMTSLFETKDARDFVVREHNALEGGNQTIKRLDEYLQNKNS